MLASKSPDQMTAEERDREITALFATALLNMSQRSALVTENSARQSANPLESPLKTRLTAHRVG